MNDDIMHRIPLTRGTFAIVDPEDYEWLNQWKWNCTTRGYAARHRKVEDGPGSETIFMHRVINETPEGYETDHINGLTLDNRRLNLRTCVRELNSKNLHLRRQKDIYGTIHDFWGDPKILKKKSKPLPTNDSLRDKEWLRLDEIAAVYGIPASTLRRRLNDGDDFLKGRQVPLRQGTSRLVWELHVSCLGALLGSSDPGEYEKLYNAFIEAMQTGFNSGKPLSKDTVLNFKYGMSTFWRYLGVKPSIEAISPESARQAMANLVRSKEQEREALQAEGKPVKESCHYGMRESIYKAVQAFYGLLIFKKMKPAEDLEALRHYKPKRSTPARRTFLHVPQIKEALDANRAWLDGRGEFGVLLTETIFMLGTYGGLRSKEIRTLKISDISLSAGVMTVEAKGKRREVGIDPALQEQIKKWLKKRPKSDSEFLMLQKSGQPLTKRVIARRIQGLAQKIGVDLTSHGCRRSAGGYWEQEVGLNWSEMKDQYGHSDINITKLYVPTDKRTAIEKLTRRKAEAPSQGPGAKFPGFEF